MNYHKGMPVLIDGVTNEILDIDPRRPDKLLVKKVTLNEDPSLTEAPFGVSSDRFQQLSSDLRRMSDLMNMNLKVRDRSK